MANTSVFHSVPILRQPQTWACWYTCFQMVVQYERGRNRGGSLKDPSEVASVQAIYDANNGIGATDPTERERVSRLLGFDVLYMSASAEGMWQLLSWAPVIYAGAWPGRSTSGRRRSARRRIGGSRTGG